MRDIQTSDDVAVIVADFYGTMADDPVLAPFFADLDMPRHVETLTRFWTSLVFSTGTYHGRPLAPHFALGLDGRHFVAWMTRFERIVGTHFAGPNADRMRQQARQIAAVFQHRLGLEIATPLA